MIGIVNVDENVRETGPHKYEIRINRMFVTSFEHNREEPLHECLLRAAVAAEFAHKLANSKPITPRPFTPPRYDEVFFAGLEALSKM